MNIRSLTRGDGVVIGAAVLLFIASFLDTFECTGTGCNDQPNAWDNGALLLGVYLTGMAGGALVVLSHLLPRPPKVLGIELGHIGIVAAVLTAWTALGAAFDPSGSFDSLDAGAGLMLGLIAALLLAAGALCGQLVPAFKAPLLGTPSPAAPPSPYGGHPQGGYGYPGAQAPGQQQPYPGPSAQQHAPGATPPGGTPGAPEFAPFWFAVPVARPLYPEDGSPTPIAELAPGTWYLAVDQRGQALVAQTQDGRRGVLQDTSGIQRG
ncbi:hypothetical protein [Streptomyces tsukubensis]|uniref:hypothetical protein n=1 Tax=Streptomyces tsukubensis TaxID=83656 RepID=UPI00344E00E9